MPTLEIHYHARDTMPELLEAKAKELDISVEQLVKRFVTAGMSEFESQTELCTLTTTLEDFMVLNGINKKSNH